MSKGYYPEVNPNPDFPEIEESVLAFWQKENLFKRSIENRKDAKEFIFYDGPPFANGLPHYGHLLTGFVKDVFARYETMKGKRVERRFGWDCHGLPAEMGSEKELRISGRQAIMKFGIGNFNEHCRTSVMKYTREWEHYVTRQARWVDFQGDYKTMDTSFMESVLWAFKQIYDKGWVYEAYRVMPYSWAAETPLSNFETKLDNSYREREDKAATVAFELKEVPDFIKEGNPHVTKCKILAWTTTPWTLPSNLALAVGQNVLYCFMVKDDCAYICADSKANEIAKILGIDAGTKFEGEKKAVATVTFPARQILGLTYEPLFPYFKDHGQNASFAKGYALETGHLYMRPFTAADSDLFYALQSDPDVAGSTSDGILPREKIEAELQRFIACQHEHGHSQWAVFEKSTNAFVGRAGLDKRDFVQFDKSGDTLTEVRYALHKPFWGKGYATELATALVEYAFHHLGVQRVIAGCSDKNVASQRILSKLGFTHDQTVLYKEKDTLYFSVTPASFRHISNGSFGHAFRILDGSGFVTDGDGTGIVHMAPGFGEDDQKVCEAKGIEIVVPVDGQGKYTDAIYDLPDLQLKGLNVIAEKTKGANDPFNEKQIEKYGLVNLRIITWLKEHGKLIKQEEIKHNYPHCWRTDQPLIYRAMPSWYVEVTKFRDRAVELNQQINWIPSHIRDGQMGHMLATAPDWSISRNRFWGTPIPVWRSKSGKIIVIGSIAELEQRSGQKVTDLHRPYIDDIIISEDGEDYKRVEDVFDCWFESGSMPFAQVHYPFENKDWFEHHFPADFITEYVGQTRGWFNTLIMLSTALFDKPPFLNCICHGVVLDAETGLKYSKRLKNYKDPLEVIDQFGADALRWLMIASPVMRGQDLMVDPDGKFIRDVVRLAIKPIWNAYNFFCLYANADGIEAKNIFKDSGRVYSLMDTYILEKCLESIQNIEAALDAYDTPSACQAVEHFFEVLNNWYIRRTKTRFWQETINQDKQDAYDTLYSVLVAMCQAAAPLLPLTLEEIFKGLTNEPSLHLTDFPKTTVKFSTDANFNSGPRVDGSFKKTNDEISMSGGFVTALMDTVRDACNAAHGVRNATNIRVRQPLKKLIIARQSKGDGAFNAEAYPDLLELIKDEVNVKEIAWSNKIDEFANLKLSINSAVLGKRLPEKMKQILPASKKGEWKQIDGGVEIAGEKLLIGEYTLQLEPKPEYKDRAQALSTNDALIILDTDLTDELIAEGIARDLVRMIQQARKDADLNVSDRIHLHLDAPADIARAVKTHAAYIMEQTLSVDLSEHKPEKPAFSAENTLDDQKVTISFSLAA